MTTDPFQPSLVAHLAWWGLRRFTSDAEYFSWQRQALSPHDLAKLHRYVEQKRRGTAADEVAFYDATADPRILPVLYSQRYDYYQAIGSRVAARLADAHTILDFGCGVGILTSFYAHQFPDRCVVGIDRSPVSIAVARQKAKELGLVNVRFDCVDIEMTASAGAYDAIVATHALVQAEQEPGIPSRNWQTFERGHDARRQVDFEGRTGIGVRLDRLSVALVPQGRLMVFEKTRQLARRVPFQRALAARGLSLIERPEPIRYQLVEEVADDGPFYVLQKGAQGSVMWDECPEPDEGLQFEPGILKTGSSDPGAPLYENHWPSAQRVWEQLERKQILKETTRQESDGRQLHVELGTAEGFFYLYCANSYDQRQIIVVDTARKDLLESYYREIISSPR